MKTIHRSVRLQSRRSAVKKVKESLALIGICLCFFHTACGGAGSGIRTTPPVQSTQHTVKLSWYANYPPVAGYNIYRGTAHGGPYSTRLNSSLQTTTSFDDSTVQSGTTYYYVVTAVDTQSQESNYSAEVEVAIPAS
jgi:hypothetical protein